MSPRFGWHGRLAVATAVCATLVVAAPANADTTVRLSRGRTALKLDGGTARALASAGIAVSASKPAKLKRGTVTFPIGAGTLDPKTGKGAIAHSGGLTLKMGSVRVTLDDILLNTRKGTAAAQIGTRAITVGPLGKGKVTRSGFATKIAGAQLKLGRAAAKALNRAFDVSAFKAGLVLGTATIAPVSKQIALDGGTTTLTFLPQVAGQLQQMGVTIAPVAPATANPATGALTFPVTGATLNAKSLEGEIRHSGGLALGTLQLLEPEITLSSTPTLAVTIATIADLDVTTPASADPKKRTVKLDGVGVKLNTIAATTVNQLLGRAVLPAGVVIATTSTTAKAR